ncbi:lipocalin family protein [Aquimarina sp. RZ0]|uniref:lipocalin family protein n=1 Tax=Aquimarina sp. RZ0 TaxID=2607730 RepID=UPI00165FC8EA|nr:lipocalin family protein [Aquimarina sp. RZ0]
MQKLNSLLILVSIITLWSCSNDDDTTISEIEITETNLVGKWQFTNFQENGVSQELSECDKMDTIELMSTENGEKTANITGHDDDNETCNPVVLSYEWKLSGKKFLLIPSIDNTEYEISSLTNETMKITNIITYQENGETIKEASISTLKKI